MTRPTIADGPFVGRTAELALLEAAWASRESAFIPIYGRRRIGKSELILQFTRDKRAIYHLGKVAPAQLQIRAGVRDRTRRSQRPALALARVPVRGPAAARPQAALRKYARLAACAPR